MTRASAMAADLLVGVAAGLAASLAMNLFQKMISDNDESNPADTATGKAADALAKAATGKKIKRTRIAAAADAVHYTTGALFGGVYGILSGLAPALTAGRGTLFGGAVWLIGDELAVPGFGLGPRPGKTALSAHGYALASHLVFGVALDATRRLLNRLIAPPPPQP